MADLPVWMRFMLAEDPAPPEIDQVDDRADWLLAADPDNDMSLVAISEKERVVHVFYNAEALRDFLNTAYNDCEIVCIDWKGHAGKHRSYESIVER